MILSLISAVSLSLTSTQNINQSKYKLPSFIDNYIEQEELLHSEKKYYENNLLKYQLVETSNAVFTDNENKDNKPSFANKVDASGTIQGTLHLNNGWTQFWQSVGEKDEDYYRFSITDRQTYYFDYLGPKGYTVRILQYGNEPKFICSAESSNFFIDLNPGTYYIHIYANDKNSITNEKYDIRYEGKRVDNIKPFMLSDYNKNKFCAVLWENELRPNNAKRFKKTNLLVTETPKRGDPVSKGYIDPIYCSKESNTKPTLKSNKIIDSILYIWGEDTLSLLANDLEKLNENIRQAIKEKQINEIKTELRGNIGSFVLDVLGFVPYLNAYVTICTVSEDLLTSIYSIILLNQDIKTSSDEYDLGYMLGRLTEACYQCIANNTILKIPFYGEISAKTSNIGNSYLKETIYSYNINCFDYDEYKQNQFIFNDDSILTTEYNEKNDNYWYGKLTSFENYGKLNNYINEKDN